MTEERELLRETVAGVCQRYCDLKVVREMEDDPLGYSPHLWRKMAGLGWLGLPFPAQYGGGSATSSVSGSSKC